MLEHISLYCFKNHQTLNLNLGKNVCVLGDNGAGKSNLLESVYLLINAMFAPGRTADMSVSEGQTAGFVRSTLMQESGLSPEYTVSFGKTGEKTSFRIQGIATSRQKYLTSHRRRAILFTPIEMNLLYLGPTLRRDFLDEILLLSHPEFFKIRKDYGASLRSRNALLKRIADGLSLSSELDAWDILFVEKATQYMKFRKKLIDFISDETKHFASCIREGLELRFQYTSKVDIDDIQSSIALYIKMHREKDVIIGHTCIGPHLDDFCFEVIPSGADSSEYLSRGENKTLLLSLKMHLVKYLEIQTGATIVLLLDDIASELDARHFSELISQIGDRPFLLTGHRIPETLFEGRNIKTINLDT